MVDSHEKPVILIAEDQEHVREALAILLRGQGYSVTMCASPNEALAAAQQRTPDVALLDMNYQRDSTSGIEGLQLIQHMRQVDGTVPIIALTAWGNVDLAVNAMKHGASDFIEKPWRNDALLEKVDSLRQRVRQVRSSQRISEFERHDAHELQTRIVPRRHLFARGIEIFGDSIPAGAVGGDYFGVWQPTPDDAALLRRRRLRQRHAGRDDCGHALCVGQHAVLVEQQPGIDPWTGRGHPAQPTRRRPLRHHFLRRVGSQDPGSTFRERRALPADLAARGWNS